MNNTIRNNTIKKYRQHQKQNNLTKKQYQYGGKFVDKGGFGCVISPALKCSVKDKDKNMEKMVSKVRKTHDSDFLNEIKISQILKKTDPGKKYYLTIEKYCYINNIPDERKDLVNVHYLDDDLSKYEILSGQADKDKNACDIDLSMKPINLIMDYGGYSLASIIRVSRKNTGTKAKMHQMFIDNLRPYFKHLILGVIKMHFNRIVNRDIKARNIMMNWNKENNQVLLRYIDFGLSDFLSNEFCSTIDNIRIKGTPTYISPEITVSYIIKKYNDHSENYVINKIYRELDENFKKNIFRINEKELLGDYKSNITDLYYKIKTLYNSNKLLPIYFGTEKNKFNGYLQKGDIYSLGISIFLALYVYSDINVRANEQLYDLLIHMIAFDPDKRYNAVQCLSHPYFHSSSN